MVSQSIANTNRVELKESDNEKLDKGEESTLTSEENQILTQQSGTGGVKSGSDDLFQHKVAAILNLQIETLEKQGAMSLQEENEGVKEINYPDKSVLIKESGYVVPSEEMEEELLDYGEDYEPTEQEKAEMEQYEKELEA